VPQVYWHTGILCVCVDVVMPLSRDQRAAGASTNGSSCTGLSIGMSSLSSHQSSYCGCSTQSTVL